MPRHTWIYLPITLVLAVIFAVSAINYLMEFHQLRRLNHLVATQAVEFTPGYIQGVTRERRSKRRYRYIAYVDYATPELRLTLKAVVSEEQYHSLYPRQQVRVIMHPENPRIAIMEGAQDTIGWSKRIAILVLIAGSIICIQLILGWLLSPKKYRQYDFSQSTHS